MKTKDSVAKPDKVLQLLAQFRAFAVDIASNLNMDASAKDVFSHSMIFQLENLGGMALEKGEARKFYEICYSLQDAIGDAISIEHVHNCGKEMLLKAADVLNTAPDTDAASRAKTATDVFWKSLQAPARVWHVCMPVKGITPPAAAEVLGSVTVFDPKGDVARGFQKQIDTIADTTRDDAETKDLLKGYLPATVFAAYPGFAFALIDVAAFDAGAAQVLAQRSIAIKLDQLNHVIDALYGPSDFFGALIAEPSYVSRPIVVVDSSPTGSVVYANEVIKASRQISIEDIRAMALKSGEYASNLLALVSKAKPSPHEQRVLTAMMWSGRSAMSDRIYDRLLFLSIAWEALVTLEKGAEITNKLVTNLVYILDDILTDRKGAAKQLRTLYQLRSEIVHLGGTEVLRSDALALREYIHYAIDKMMVEPHFLRMVKGRDLIDWLEERSLGITPNAT